MNFLKKFLTGPKPTIDKPATPLSKGGSLTRNDDITIVKGPGKNNDIENHVLILEKEVKSLRNRTRTLEQQIMSLKNKPVNDFRRRNFDDAQKRR